MLNWRKALGAAAILCALAAISGNLAHADGGPAQYRWVDSCNSTFGPTDVASSSTVTVDKRGNLCTVVASGGGGGGGAATLAAGAVAAGAYVAGAVLAGALVDVLATNVDIGAPGDTVCATDTGSCSLNALLQRIAARVTSLITVAQNALASQSPAVPIGGVSICDGANGTTNPCTTAATVLAASTAPAAANKSLSVSVNPLSMTQGASKAISVSTATTTEIVALSGSTKIFVTSYDVLAGGTGNITFEYGTGTACATGTTVLTGPYNLTAQAGISKGSGAGAILFVPAGNALCVLTSAAVQMSGSVSYLQF